jgi:hypothetical protein
MAMPFIPNTTCDIYHTGTTHGIDPPNESAVPIYLKGEWEQGQEAGSRTTARRMYTHIAHMNDNVDIRDIYGGGSAAGGSPDDIWVPDQNGVPYTVTFVERVTREQANNHYRVYLDRQAVVWPTDIL